MSKTKKYLAILLAALTLLGLSIVFAQYDLKIWLSIGNTESIFGLLMETLGEMIAPLMCAASGAILAVYYYKQASSYTARRLKGVISSLIVVGGIGYSVLLLISRDLAMWIRALSFILIAIFCIIVVLTIKRIGEERLFQLYCIALTTVIYSVAIFSLILIIKTCWGRIRPRDLLEHASFTMFFDPQGITGNRSFPSGHTANAAILYAITLFAPLVKPKLGKFALYAVPVVWIFIMALSRVVVGAHFASDVLYGASLSILTFYIVKRLTYAAIEKGLAV